MIENTYGSYQLSVANPNNLTLLGSTDELGSEPVFLPAVDLDGDDRSDIVIVNRARKRLTWKIITTPFSDDRKLAVAKLGNKGDQPFIFHRRGKAVLAVLPSKQSSRRVRSSIRKGSRSSKRGRKKAHRNTAFIRYCSAKRCKRPLHTTLIG